MLKKPVSFSHYGKLHAKETGFVSSIWHLACLRSWFRFLSMESGLFKKLVSFSEYGNWPP